ncbi:hypothetical protein HQ587_00875 [bacterium]|nr:hypothetical protein [bacterium]
MGKYTVVIIIGIALIVAVLVLNRALQRGPDESSITYQKARKVQTGEIIEPEMVKVTIGDSLYHNPSCDWIGHGAKKMTLENAIKRGFCPCSQCIEEED